MRIASSFLCLLVLGLAIKPTASAPVKVVPSETRALERTTSGRLKIRDDSSWQIPAIIGGALVALGGGAAGIRWLWKGFNAERKANTRIFTAGVYQVGERRADNTEAADIKLIEV